MAVITASMNKHLRAWRLILGDTGRLASTDSRYPGKLTYAMHCGYHCAMRLTCSLEIKTQ